jgi:hypothetical protein
METPKFENIENSNTEKLDGNNLESRTYQYIDKYIEAASIDEIKNKYIEIRRKVFGSSSNVKTTKGYEADIHDSTITTASVPLTALHAISSLEVLLQKEGIDIEELKKEI